MARRRTAKQTAALVATTRDWVAMILENGTCRRVPVAVGSTSCVGTVIHAEADDLSTGTWEIVDHSTGNPAIYLSMPSQRYTVSMVSESLHGVVRNLIFRTDDLAAAHGYIERLKPLLSDERRTVSWDLVCERAGL